MNIFLHIAYRLVLLSCFLCFFSITKAGNITGIHILSDTVPHHVSSDTVPQNPPPRKRSNIVRYFNIISDQQQRDSLFGKLGRTNATTPQSDSVIWKMRENVFNVYGGKKIRYIYYNQLKVFGTTIEDTTVIQSKLIRFANKLHYDTRTWAIRQALFFKEGDTVNAYTLVDNERYLRRLPFIQDARLYVINSYENSDSIDIVVLTKDLFEYGGSLNGLSNTHTGATIFNTNFLGAAQRLGVGFNWNNQYTPQWRTGVGYTKYNLGGSFTDVSFGYSALNDRPTADTGQYEKSAYLTINRPLYSTSATFTGGLTLQSSKSINILGFPDTIYRHYKYGLIDAWAGYNFSNQYKKSGFNSFKPNIGIELRSFNMDFNKRPDEPQLEKDPNYNSHYFLLSQLVFYHQDFFKTNYFFGFGRTEDIPLGYTYSASFALDSWTGLKRSYTAVQAQKYWLPGKNLISTSLALGGFWYNGQSQDAVLHITTDYYSNLFRLKGPKMREFLHADYIIDFNPVLYKPVNINQGNGIVGYRYTLFNNYQRLNLSAQTEYYSPLSLYGFKFNFYLQLQASLLASQKESVFNSPFYSGVTAGVQIRNENLSFNTLQISATYQPIVDKGPNPLYAPKGLFVYVTSVTAFNFPIFALTQPTLIQYR